MKVDLALSGSSTKITGHVGAAQAVLERVEPVRVSGTSGGAIVAALISVMTPTEAWWALREQDFSKYFKFNWWSALRWLFWGYLSSGKELREDLEAHLGDYTLDSPELKYDLYLIASDMTLGEPIVFSKHTHPKMRLSDAVYRSACMPGVFKPLNYNGHHIRDGAVYKDFPIDVWEDFPRPRIGHYFQDSWQPKADRPWGGVLEHQLLLSRAIDANLDASIQAVRHRAEVLVVESPTQGISNLSFDVTVDQQEDLRQTGYLAVQGALDKWLPTS